MKSWIAALCLCPLQALAQTDGVERDYNAETMLNLCKGEAAGTPENVQSLICTFRIQGVGEMLNFNCTSRAGGYQPAPTLTARVVSSRGAARQAFINYMEDHPDIWNDYWAVAVALALSETFPCEN